MSAMKTAPLWLGDFVGASAFFREQKHALKMKKKDRMSSNRGMNIMRCTSNHGMPPSILRRPRDPYISPKGFIKKP
jgi:hypothetical protein